MNVRPLFGNMSTLTAQTQYIPQSAKASFYALPDPTNFDRVTLTMSMPYSDFRGALGPKAFALSKAVGDQIRHQVAQYEAQWPLILSEATENFRSELIVNHPNVLIQTGAAKDYQKLFQEYTNIENEPVLILKGLRTVQHLSSLPGVMNIKTQKQNDQGVSYTFMYFPKKAGSRYFTPVKGVVIS